MKWDELKTEPCSVARTLSVIGEKWTILILRECFRKNTRFDGFEAALGLPRAVLSARLKTLQEDGVLEKKINPEHAGRFDYILTKKGRDLRPVLLTMLAWGDQYMMDKPTMIVKHTLCGCDIVPELYCPKCQNKLEAEETRVVEVTQSSPL